MQNEPMPRENLSATRADINNALAAFKVELMGIFVTKEEAKEFATKTELAAVRRDLSKEIMISRIESATMGEKLAELIRQTRSDLMGAVENAIFKAEKVYRDQLITHQRVDGLETRVTALETRRIRRRPN